MIPVSAAFNHIGKEFADDLLNLHPLSKLRGINTNEHSNQKYPNLLDVTEHYADELVVCIDEILNPAQDIQACDSW